VNIALKTGLVAHRVWGEKLAQENKNASLSLRFLILKGKFAGKSKTRLDPAQLQIADL